MATVTEEAVAVPAVGAGEAEAAMEEKVEDVKEGAAVEDKVEEVKEAQAGEVEEKVEDVKEAQAGEVEEKVEEAGEVEEKGEGEAEEAKVEGEQAKGKAKKPRSRKPRSEGPHHPPYFEMIKEAIMGAGDGKAEASTYAIAKHMAERHGDALPGNYRKVLAVQLRHFAAKGRLVRVKASFRLAPAEEKKASKKRRGTSTKKGAPKKGRKAAPAPAPARTKRAKKAAPPAQPKPKQPKSIRTGMARRANMASA